MSMRFQGSAAVLAAAVVIVLGWIVAVNTASAAFDFSKRASGRSPSMKIDSNGQLHLAYYDHLNGDLKYTRKPAGSNWVTPVTVDGVGDVGDRPSLALYGNEPRIAYYDRGKHRMKYVKKSGSNWGTPDTSFGNGHYKYMSLAINGNDEGRIAAYDSASGDLILWYQQGSTWATPLGGDQNNGSFDVGRFPSMGLTSGDSPRTASQQQPGGSVSIRLSYGFTGSGTDVSSYGLGCEEPSLAVRTDDRVAIVYATYNDGLLAVRDTTGGFTGTNTADDTDYAYAPSLALAYGNYERVAYYSYDETNGQTLKYGLNNLGWYSDVVDPNADTSYRHCSLVLNSGCAIIAYVRNDSIWVASQVCGDPGDDDPPIIHQAGSVAQGSIGELRFTSPNPRHSGGPIAVELTASAPGTMRGVLVDLRGHVVSDLGTRDLAAGVNRLHFQVGDLAAGLYFLQARTSGGHVAAARLVQLD
jgi:hypothetical protein